MKKLLILLIVFLSFTVRSQNEINFREGSFSEIMKQAKAENKPVFFMFFAKWCSHCNKMKAEVFTDAAVAEFYNTNFICAKFDMEEGEGKQLKREYNIKAYPVLLYFSPEGEMTNRVSKELKAQPFITEGKNALNPETQFSKIRQNFLSDFTNADKCMEYIAALRKGLMDTNDAAKQYLATQKDNQLASADNWKIIANGITDIHSREFQFVVKNQAAFGKVASQSRVEKKILSVVSQTLNPFVESSDTIRYNQARPIAAEIKLSRTDSLIFAYDLRILEKTQNWKGYQKTASASAKKMGWNNSGLLKEIGKVYAKNVDDKIALKEAIIWAERSLELAVNYDTYLVIARLQLKTGNKNTALEFAEKGQKMAAQYQWNTKEADELILEISKT